MMVPTASPDMIAAAMELYMASVMSGSMPRIVVYEAITTGRVRLIAAVTTAS